jgi:hypothetical protein
MGLGLEYIMLQRLALRTAVSTASICDILPSEICRSKPIC